MSIVNRRLLDSLGVEISDEHMRLLDEHFEETLDKRVIAEVVIEMDDDKLLELQSLLQDSTDAQLHVWLRDNVADLKEIIEDETAILLGEFAEHSQEFNE